MIPLASPEIAAFARYRPLIDDWDAFTAALTRPLPTCVWINTLRATPEQGAAWLAGEGLSAEPLGWLAPGFHLAPGPNPALQLPYIAGLYHIQEEVSMLPPVLLAPRRGERVLDLCAAPGGKTAQIAVMMQNEGTVVANDRSAGRMNVLRTTIDRLGLLNVTTTVYDAVNYPVDDAGFDRVLADVPCTGEGTSRKYPGRFYPVEPGRFEAMSRIQRLILRKAVRLCNPGGRIVYSTCTYAPEENECVVDAVLDVEAGVRLVPAAVDGFTASPGLTHWEGRALHADLRHALRIWPHQNDTGGFFIAVLEKNGAPR
jgi:NOL1/NOP2/sun family putative RNA methylase